MNPERAPQKRSLRDRLSENRALLGLLQLHPSVLLVETAARCGYDYLVLDAEHGVFEKNDYSPMLRALAATDVLAMVRLADHSADAIAEYLSFGVDAIIAPHVSTAAQARALVRAMEHRADVALLVLIESVQGVANAADILSVDGVTGAFVGPHDLTEDMGCKGDYARPEYEQALARVEAAALAAGKGFGTAPHGDYQLPALFTRGHRMFLVGTDASVLQDAMNTKIAQSRSCLEPKDQ